jgi:cytidyltransferase-like protein
MKISVVTGGFDPIHSGHIAYIEEASRLGDLLIVGLNSDQWLKNKKGRAFMSWEERASVLKALKNVNKVESFDDSNGSAIDLLIKLKKQYPYAEIVFANGGDRTDKNIPEMSVTGVKFVFGIGGFNKANSSSWILEEWKAPKTERPWGYYRVLHEVPGTKVKELTINPGHSISLQKHNNRAEYWHISEGRAIAESYMENGYKMPSAELKQHSSYQVPVGEWHKLLNPHTEPVKIIEIQYGVSCVEEDIERR